MSVVFRSHIALACRGPHVAPNHSATPMSKSLAKLVRAMASLQIQSGKTSPKGTLYIMKSRRKSLVLQQPQEHRREQVTATKGAEKVAEVVVDHLEVCEPPSPKWSEWDIRNINGC